MICTRMFDDETFEGNNCNSVNNGYEYDGLNDGIVTGNILYS